MARVLSKNDMQGLQMKVIFEVKLNTFYRSFSYKIQYLPHTTELEATDDGKEIFNAFNQLIRNQH